jgi:hypothetical protein
MAARNPARKKKSCSFPGYGDNHETVKLTSITPTPHHIIPGRRIRIFLLTRGVNLLNSIFKICKIPAFLLIDYPLSYFPQGGKG